MEKPFFHVGILVRDVEAARADFAAKLGVEFEPVHSQQIATGETIRFCYSLQGAPYLEVLRELFTGSPLKTTRKQPSLTLLAIARLMRNLA